MAQALGVAVAGGGTGGHVFPGLALAREFRRRDARTRVLYIGVAGKIEERVIPAAGLDFRGVKVRGLTGGGWKGGISSLVLAGRAFLLCRRLLSDFKADLLVGVGGYSSGPAALAARALGIPLVLQEQNAIPGLTNRLLGRMAGRIFVAMEPARRHFPGDRVVVTGNPIREEALASPSAVGLEKRLRVLVLGGSRGAGGLNRLVSAALTRLGLPPGLLEFVHQSGEEDREMVEAAYRAAGFRAAVLRFIEEMNSRYAWADVVIARAGAGTVAELAVSGRPAILVPFPRSAAGHQGENARWLAERGGAIVIEETRKDAPRDLAEALGGLARDRGRLREMSVCSRQAGIRGAAARIVSECYELLGVQRG